MKRRVSILPLATNLSSLCVTDEFILVMPLSVCGYTLVSDSAFGQLIIGISIHTHSELKDLLCNCLGYAGIKEGLGALLSRSDICNKKRILKEYTKTQGHPISEEWIKIRQYMETAQSTEYNQSALTIQDSTC